MQNRDAVQGRSESQQHVVAHRRGGREAQLARGGIREHEAFMANEIKGRAGTGRDGAKAQGRRMG